MKRRGQDRPIVVKFLHWRQRQEVIDQARFLLKDSIDGYRVAEDFSYAVREKRKLLYPKMKTARDDGKRASMRGDKLLIEGVFYEVDSSKNVVQTGQRLPERRNQPT